MESKKRVIEKVKKYSIGTYESIAEEWRLLKIFKKNDMENMNYSLDSLDVQGYHKGKCLCGHNIDTHVIFENIYNGTRICAGEDCAKYIGENLYGFVKRIARNRQNMLDVFERGKIKKPCDESIEIAYDEGIISEYEKNEIMKNKTFYTKGTLRCNVKLDIVITILKLSSFINNRYFDDITNYTDKYLFDVVSNSGLESLCEEYSKRYAPPKPIDELYKYKLMFDAVPQWKHHKKKVLCDKCRVSNFYMVEYIFDGFCSKDTMNYKQFLGKFICRIDNNNVCYKCVQIGDHDEFYNKDGLLYLTKKFCGGKCRKCGIHVSANSKRHVYDYNGEKLICDSCWNAKEFINEWILMINYNCDICDGWNFRHPNSRNEHKKRCFKCVRLQKTKRNTCP